MTKISSKRTLILGLVLIAMNLGMAQFYDGSNLSFGKNRIQYQEFLWQYYRFDRYDTYFYEGGKEIATHVSQVAPGILKDMENRLDYVVQDRMEFIIYNNQTEFKQSNLGLVSSNQQTEIGGNARIVGSKIFLFFEGDYTKLDQQVRAGICRMIINDMLYGGDWKDVIKNSALMNFPDWYTEGLVSYYSDGWNANIQDRVRDGVISGRYEKFNRLNDEESIYAGHSIWKYIADQYGESVIPNILYMAKINRSIESGFIFVLGLQLTALMEEHEIYYTGIFEQQSMGRAESEMFEAQVKTKKNQVYGQYKLSPDGKKAAFTSNVLGQYRVWVYDIDEYHREDIARRKAYDVEKAEHDRKEAAKQATSKDYRAKAYKAYKPKLHPAKKIYKAEHKLDRIVDKSYPVLEWNPRGTELSFITESKGTVWLNTYSIADKKTFKRELFGLQKVLAFDYSHTGKKLVMSGVNNGQSDIYLYHLLGNRQERLTNDNFDDLEPRFLNKSQKVVFTSNRVDDTLRVKHKSPILPKTTDVFTLNLNDRKANLERITSTPEFNESMPFQYDSLRYTYLSDRLGMNNRFVATYDSTISRVDTVIHYRYFTREEQITNDDRSAIEYHVNAKKRKYAVLKFIDGGYRFYHSDIGKDSFSDIVVPEDGQPASGLDDGNATNSPTVVILYD